ncbi:MAG: LacI family DNA-binding transcriptional regulator [Solirubrobacteraceae bacterium]
MGDVVSRRPTLDTVARALGVSRMTVSNAYNKPDQLSVQTREAVLEMARSLGYGGPSAAGRSLRRGMSGTIGVLLTERLPYAFADPGTIAFLHGLATELADARRALQLIPSDGDPDSTLALVRGAIVDAFVVNGLDADDPIMSAVLERRLPLVTAGSPRLVDVPFVSVANAQAAWMAAEALIGLGHTRIGTVTYRAQLRTACDGGLIAVHQCFHDRLLGYEQAFTGAALPNDQLCTRAASTNSRAGGRQAARDMLSLAPEIRPTGLLAMTDVLALGAIDAAHELGLAVPDDVSVVGFDDIEEARRSSPPLTTIRQGLFEQGQNAAALALAIVAGEVAEADDFPTELVVRASTAPPTTDHTHRPTTA